MNLELFRKDNLQVRIIKDENNEPLFCLKDVCDVLELTNNRMVAEAINVEFDKGGKFNLHPCKTKGGMQNLIFISEAELYFVMMRSRSKNAKPFRIWVNKEVLPSIRKNGSYGYKPLSLKESLQMQLELLERNEKLQIENANLKNEAKENASLIHFVNRIQNTNDAILVRDFAKILHEKKHLEIGEKRLFRILREKGFLMSDNKPYQKYIEQGLFKVSETTISTINGDRLVSTTKITGKGQIAILKAILKAS
ncbi:TPA: phage antirepressor KilAC domain-containing protein [Campylobacter jejuni]|nr:phage antirepressor KilAC domain-containing protein [Campylobacter jejuni]HDZ5012309.1 phage antirepressor KilAC domain-containing protein [Campylobacter jejuni]HDZ5015984.1 phage antirepressor KilAC domain-containing protein [Campylobacter jejuni]HDZ5024122.1 phage antirepressor KilAC domain-containing protein [Campylobacter jejuni]HDZ5032223.1 phage antirepressor KilAC domain-containing protein [Campylobacter jejuni]